MKRCLEKVKRELRQLLRMGPWRAAMGWLEPRLTPGDEESPCVDSTSGFFKWQ